MVTNFNFAFDHQSTTLCLAPKKTNKQCARASCVCLEIPKSRLGQDLAVARLYCHIPAKSWVGCIIGFDKPKNLDVPIYCHAPVNLWPKPSWVGCIISFDNPNPKPKPVPTYLNHFQIA